MLNMAKLRSSNIVKKKTSSSIFKLRIVVDKLQKRFRHLAHKSSSFRNNLPDHVKEGHFAAIAVEDDHEKKFVVPLSYLRHPSFLRLLEGAAEEYGFDHEGALTIPCQPGELERMLAEQLVAEEREIRVAVNWNSCKTKVESC